MNWNKGYIQRIYYTIVDPVTWRDIEERDLIGGSIMKSADRLMETADLDITSLPESGEAWIRIYLNATQNDTGEKEALFTGLMQAPEIQWNGTQGTYAAEAYSVLKPASDVLLPRGWYAPSGMNGARLAAELLGIGAAPVQYEDASPQLTTTIVAESKESNLSMAQKIIEAIGWRIRIMGDGRIVIAPAGAERLAVLDALENDIIELEVNDRRDWYSCPNVLRVTQNDLIAVARDDSPDSLYSTVRRGREIWKEENRTGSGDGESIEEYAARRLKEEQMPQREIEYTRRYLPGIFPGDIIGIRHPAQNIDGDFRIVTQKISLEKGIKVSEECEAYG